MTRWREKLLGLYAVLPEPEPPAELRTVPVSCPSPTGPVFAALDIEGGRHILLGVGPDSIVAEEVAKAVSIRRRNLVVGAHHGTFVDLAVHDRRLCEIFVGLVADVLDAIAAGGDAATAPRDVLLRWRELIDRRLVGRLRQQEAVGLFGELCVLERLMAGAPLSALAWLGPLGHPHDLDLSTRAIEVKSTSAVADAVVEIHGLEQLAAPADKPLDLVFVRLRADPAARSIVELANAVEAVIEQPDEFRLRAGAAGLYLDEPERFEEFRFDVVEMRGLHITDAVPRIIASTFGDGVPDELSDVRYRVDLSKALTSGFDF